MHLRLLIFVLDIYRLGLWAVKRDLFLDVEIMGAVDVLIVIDTDGAASSGNLRDNVSLVEMVDGADSWSKLCCDLITCCKAGQTVKWKAIPKSPESAVEILEFKGQMVQGVCKPIQKNIFTGIWEGQIDPSSNGRYQYSVDLVFDGIRMSFDPYILVNKE